MWGHRLQGKQIWWMLTLKATCFSVVNTMTSQMLVMAERKTSIHTSVSSLASTAPKVQSVGIMLFLHNFPYYLEKIKPVSNVLDYDFNLNNGHIHEGRPQLRSLFCSFCLLSKACVITHTHTHTRTHAHTAWNATGYNSKVFEWQSAGENLSLQHYFRDRQDFDRRSYKMMTFDKGLKKKKKDHVATPINATIKLSYNCCNDMLTNGSQHY